jgi:endonuclease YncB( thermonuclease family)
VTFQYNALVERVVDGDTLVCRVDLGFGIWYYTSLRLLGINARERSQVGGPEASTNLETMLPSGTALVVDTVKPDKYGGRYDARIHLNDGRDLAGLLVHDGWAAPWNGAGTKPVPPWPRMAS